MNKRKFADGGIYTAEMGQPPVDPEGGPPNPRPVKRPLPKPGVPKPGVPKPPIKRPLPIPAPMPAASAPVYKKGGSVGSASKRADGIASKGKTKGKMIAMKNGGYTC